MGVFVLQRKVRFLPIPIRENYGLSSALSGRKSLNITLCQIPHSQIVNCHLPHEPYANISKLHPHLHKYHSGGKHAGVKAVHYEATISNFKAGYMSFSMKIPFFRFLANSLTNNQSTKASHQSAQLKNE